MSNVLKEYFTGIANSIREMTGSEELISVQDFSNKIRGIDLGVIIPEFISVDLDDEYNLTWTISDNYMLDRYQHNIYFKLTINGQEFILTENETSFSLLPYVAAGLENLAVITLLVDIYGKEESQIHIDKIAVDEIKELSYIPIQGEYTLGFCNDHIYTVGCSIADGGQGLETVKRQNILTGEIEDLGVPFSDGSGWNARSGASAQVTIGDRIWAYSGWSQALMICVSWSRVFDTSINNYIEELNKETSDLQYVRWPVGAAVGTNAYIFGGQNNGYKSQITKHDTITNELTRLSVELPHGSGKYDVAFDFGICSHSDNIYLIAVNTTEYGDPGNEIWKFNATNETMEKLDLTLPANFNSPVCVNFRNKIYIFTAEQPEHNGGIYVFDPDNLTLEKLDIEYNIVPQYGHVYNDKVYLFSVTGQKAWTFGK